MATENKKLPENLTIKDIFAGECKVPEMLQQFLKYVICGPDPRRNNSIIKNRRIESICQDVIFATTSGLKIPSKHLQVGLVMKSLTGSKKAVEILNRLGHSVSYNTVEELETELTFTATKENLLSPDGMSLSSDKATGLAFDNYDCFVETLSGKDTLHDTVGIAYQLVSDNADNCQLSVENENEIVTPGTKRKRRRAYESPAIEIEPYRKKTKMMQNPMLPVDHIRRTEIPTSLQQAKVLDFVWMFECTFNPNHTPMWTGWNSQRFQNETDSKQKVFYLSQIN